MNSSQTIRHIVGGMSAVAAIAFNYGLYGSMRNFVWGTGTEASGLIGFFGFGFPLLFFGIGAVALLESNRPLYQLFGWACMVAALFWASSLFSLVTGWVKAAELSREFTLASGIATFLGFFLPTAIWGGAGVQVLIAMPGQSKKNSN